VGTVPVRRVADTSEVLRLLRLWGTNLLARTAVGVRGVLGVMGECGASPVEIGVRGEMGEIMGRVPGREWFLTCLLGVLGW
jgi:hypothetical protein